MRFLVLLLFVSTSLSAQINNVQNQIKFRSYGYLDSIDVYSKEYPTKLIEGSGSILNKHHKNIGSIGFSTEITTDKNNKVIRIRKSESYHYERFRGKPQKSVINEITIYFNDFQKPDLAKYISKTYISDALVTSKNILFDILEKHDGNKDFKPVKKVLDETINYVK